MKLVTITGGVIATIGGILVIPGLALFLGALVVAVISTLFLCTRLDNEYMMTEKMLYSLMGNVICSVALFLIVPASLAIEVGGEVLILAGLGSFFGSFIGGGIASYYEPVKKNER